MTIKRILLTGACAFSWLGSSACVPNVTGAQTLGHEDSTWVYIKTNKASVDGVWRCVMEKNDKGDDAPVCYKATLRD